MPKRKRLTLKEKKKLYKTIAGYKAAKRKKNAEHLNRELNIKFTEAKTVYRYVNGISVSDSKVHRNFDKAFKELNHANDPTRKKEVE